MNKIGRPTVRPEPKTQLSKRLQSILPEQGMRTLSSKYFGDVATKTVGKYLSGELEPPPSALQRIAEIEGCELNWLAWGNEEKSPPKSGGEVNYEEDNFDFRRLFSTLEVAHGALSDIAGRVEKGHLAPGIALQAVEAALDTLLKAHDKSAKEDSAANTKAGKGGTGTK